MRTTWIKDRLDINCIIKETERACLIRIPHSAFEGFVFWFPKSMIKKIRRTDQYVRAIYPAGFGTIITKDEQVYQTYAEFAFSCINQPHLHKENIYKMRREFEQLAGF